MRFIKSNSFTSLGVVAFTIIASLVLIYSGVNGQSSTNGSGQGLEISPPLVELNVDPGSTVETSLKLRNITDSQLVATPRVEDFVAQGEDGIPKLLLNEDQNLSSYTFKPWVQQIPVTTINAKEQKSIKVVFNVPADASPGGHYGVIRFTASSPEVSDTGVSLSASIGSLVLVKVSGDVKESANIVEFYASKSGKKSSFFEQSPITLAERIKNTGNVHVKPQGKITIKDMFGKEVSKIKINDNGGNILPDSIRKFEQSFSKKLLFGRYSADANITYGNNQKLSKSTSFWVIPYKLLALCVIIVIAVVVLIKRYNSYIVKKANKRR